MLKVSFDHTKGIRGRLVLHWMSDVSGLEVDREVIFKHPHWLRLRMALAAWRMKRRQRKIAIFLANR
jgi:hypothetical protein